MENDRAIVVFTGDSWDKICAEGGSGNWVISPKVADKCQYIVCCRKRSWSNRSDDIQDRSAFVIGKIAGLIEHSDVANERGQSRYLIQMSDYAKIDHANIWVKERRNPVSYSTLKDLGIDARALKFKPMPQAAAAPNTKGNSSGAMTIQDAKKGLALTFGVSPDDIEITIRG